jgi:hypothetical protein
MVGLILHRCRESHFGGNVFWSKGRMAESVCPEESECGQHERRQDGLCQSRFAGRGETGRRCAEMVSH